MKLNLQKTKRNYGHFGRTEATDLWSILIVLIQNFMSPEKNVPKGSLFLPSSEVHLEPDLPSLLFLPMSLSFPNSCWGNEEAYSWKWWCSKSLYIMSPSAISETRSLLFCSFCKEWHSPSLCLAKCFWCISLWQNCSLDLWFCKMHKYPNPIGFPTFKNAFLLLNDHGRNLYSL